MRSLVIYIARTMTNFIKIKIISKRQSIWLLYWKNDITNGSILELGSGTGKHAEIFAKMGFSVHGVDLSPEMIREENQRGNNDFANQLYF